jgi:3-methyladenine DNA glycosylase/8-oxoguanine DNA glycosylase
VARWIVSTIQLAYSLTNTSPDLHEVRALATSWAAYRGVALGALLEAATWSNHSTFSQFYLRNCSVLADGIHSIGPVVAAQHMV